MPRDEMGVVSVSSLVSSLYLRLRLRLVLKLNEYEKCPTISVFGCSKNELKPVSHHSWSPEF